MNTRTAEPIVGTVIQVTDNGGAEDLISFAGGLISYRFQRHSWITDDGRLHIMVRMDNDPLPAEHAALALFSSNDYLSGRTEYKLQDSLERSGGRIYQGVEIKSSSDAILDGNTLYVVYNTFRGEIKLFIFDYVNEKPPYWDRTDERTVYDERTQFRATKPSIAKDRSGRIWVGFMVCNFGGQNVAYESKVYYAEEADDYTNWKDSDFDNDVDLEPITEGDPVKPHRSVRLLSYSTYICAIVSDRISFYHTYIDGPPSDTNKWSSKKLIYTIPDPVSPMEDTNRAHFSAVVRRVDGKDHIHFVTNNGDNNDAHIVYASYQNDNLPIDADELDPTVGIIGHYPQISQYSSSELYIVYDRRYSAGGSNQCRGLVILEENGVGSDWAVKDQLVLPGTYCDTDAARSIIPELIPDDNDIPVHQQIHDGEDPDVYKLVLYEVPGP